MPPLVLINGRYYGWRLALYIAGIMWLSIIATSLIIHYMFNAIGITPKSGQRIEDVVRFGLDYTFFLNILFVAVAGLLVWLATRHRHDGMDHDMPGDSVTKTVAAILAAVINGAGVVAFFLTR